VAYVEGFKHDVFVSYARVDDQRLPTTPSGWVSTLLDALEIRLAQKLGRAEKLSVWRDIGLEGNAPVTDSILEALDQSALLLAVLSNGYLESRWCNDEQNRFLVRAGARTRRLFVVHRMNVVRERQPAVFSDRVAYPFWIQERKHEPELTLGEPEAKAHEDRYFHVLNKLAGEMAAELRRMDDASPSGASGARSQDPQAVPVAPRVVFLPDSIEKRFAMQVSLARLFPERSHIAKLVKQCGAAWTPPTSDDPSYQWQDALRVLYDGRRDIWPIVAEALAQPPGRDVDAWQRWADGR
jgi:hypothetical protein